MKIVNNLFHSTLGRKYLMALTGAGLFGFTVMHMLGNLQIFLGSEAINRYAHFLQSNKELLWPARLGLLAMVALHIWSAVKLSAENKAARAVGYRNDPAPAAASYASRTMLMSGLIVAAFIIYHLLHFTVKAEAVNLVGRNFADLHDLDLAGQSRADVYQMLLLGFQQPAVAIFYVIAVGLLCLHLSHGLSAMFQSLGLRNKAWWPVLQQLARAASLLLFLGYIAVPLAVLLRLVE
jgi:succinate dehydrogenase / fumarate reductase cytochrome b subunit